MKYTIRHHGEKGFGWHISTCRLCIGVPQKRFQEVVLCASLLEMGTLADPGSYREQRGVHENILCYYVFHNSTLITDMYPLSTLNFTTLITLYCTHSSPCHIKPTWALIKVFCCSLFFHSICWDSWRKFFYEMGCYINIHTMTCQSQCLKAKKNALIGCTSS